MSTLDQGELRLLEQSIGSLVQRAGGTLASGDIWPDLAEAGLLAINAGADNDGIDGGATAIAIVTRALGASLVDCPFIASAVMATEIIKQAGSADQRNRLIEALVQGRAVMTVAHAEAAEGLSPSRISATARREEGGYVLTGRKDFILQGALADTLIVSALLDGEPALFLVDPAAENLIRMTYDAIDGRSCDSFVLDGVRIPDSDRLPGPARIALDRAFALAALATCAEAAGIAAAVNAATLEYIKTREQFAVPIGSFQVLQHRMVDMFVAEQEMDAIARRAARLFDGASPDAARWISAAKATLDRAGRLIVHQALQLHGGMGMTRELAVGDYLKRMLLLASLYGDARWHLLRLEPGSRETASGDPAGPQAPVRRVAAHAG